jgi:hypothetical protein
VTYDLASRSVGSLRVRIYDIASGVTVPAIGTVVTLADSTTGLSITGELIDISQTGLSDGDVGQLLDLVVEDPNALPAQVLITGILTAGSTPRGLRECARAGEAVGVRHHAQPVAGHRPVARGRLHVRRRLRRRSAQPAADPLRMGMGASMQAVSCVTSSR